VTGRVLRIVGLTLMGLTAVITLLGGIGTICVALGPARFDSMAALAPYQWLYILYVLIGIATGVLGIWATIWLIKGRPHAYRLALIALISGLIVGGVHMATSRALRGGSMPVDFIVYVTALTLVLFLLLRFPAIWARLNLAGRDGSQAGLGAGTAMIVAGITILTVQLWAGPSHTVNGVNYADVWHAQLTLAGWLVTLPGSGLLVGVVMERSLPALKWRPRRAGG
jgi:hypothetical protein